MLLTIAPSMVDHSFTTWCVCDRASAASSRTAETYVSFACGRSVAPGGMFIEGSSPFGYTVGMRRRGFLLSILALLAFLTPAAAQWRHAPFEARGVQRLDRILPGIRSAHPGRFYDAEGPFPDATGGLHYRIKWLTPDGRVIWLDTDARSGRVIGPAGPPPGIPPAAGQFGPVPPGMGPAYRPGPWGRPAYPGWRGGGRGRWPGR